jgi:hypothetical protein
MLARRLGLEESRALAASASLEHALGVLSGSAYGRSVRPGGDLSSLQRAIAETALWHVRVLAGWMPPRALDLLRALAGWFELANVEDRLGYLAGGPLIAPFVLGGLATGGSRLESALSIAELRQALKGSPWGDPGSDDPAAIRLALRFAWARRTLSSAPEAREWALGALALLLARELLFAGRSPDELAVLRPPVPGTAWMGSQSVDALRRALPPECGWALAGVAEPDGLWLAEAAWWRRVELDAEVMARDPQMGRATVIGVVALLGADAVRVAAALESASRGGDRMAIEAYENVF